MCGFSGCLRRFVKVPAWGLLTSSRAAKPSDKAKGSLKIRFQAAFLLFIPHPQPL